MIFRILLPVLLFSFSIFQGCKPGNTVENDRLVSLVDEPGSDFGGAKLGMKEGELVAKMGRKAFHKDALGLSFRDSIEGGIERISEYYFKKDRENTRRLSGIIVNFNLEDEVQAADVFGVLETWLSGKLGVPEGSPGGKTWNSTIENREVILSLSDQKVNISLNIIFPQEL